MDLSKFRLRLDGESYAVIGVMPEGFDFPHGVAAWIPLELYPAGSSRTAPQATCVVLRHTGTTRLSTSLGIKQR